MKTMIRAVAAVFAVTLIASSTSFAQPAPVPEVDLGMGASALALLGGVILAVRGRKRS